MSKRLAVSLLAVGCIADVNLTVFPLGGHCAGVFGERWRLARFPLSSHLRVSSLCLPLALSGFVSSRDKDGDLAEPVLLGCPCIALARELWPGGGGGGRLFEQAPFGRGS